MFLLLAIPLSFFYSRNNPISGPEGRQFRGLCYKHGIIEICIDHIVENQSETKLREATKLHSGCTKEKKSNKTYVDESRYSSVQLLVSGGTTYDNELPFSLRISTDAEYQYCRNLITSRSISTFPMRYPLKRTIDDQRKSSRSIRCRVSRNSGSTAALPGSPNLFLPSGSFSIRMQTSRNERTFRAIGSGARSKRRAGRRSWKFDD